jgi:hypothetical protein
LEDGTNNTSILEIQVELNELQLEKGEENSPLLFVAEQ